ncbi:MAG: efflux RND transporter permease subunit [Rubrivivax sp.]|nr:efflux RND transporter permease subunit [Rubrivivax sp.]
MWFTRVSIANPVMAVMVMLAFVVLGLFSYQRLSLDQFPNIDFPTVVVSMDYPGASPEIVEAEVTKKIEEAVNTIAGISSLYSRSYEGVAVVIIEFNLDADGRKAADDVREKVSLIRPLLREEVKDPRISRFDPAAQPIFNVAVLATDGKATPQELTTWATQVLQKKLENVRGVGAVSVVGGVQRQVSIHLKPAAMEALGVSTEQVAAALRSENQELPLGNIRSAEQDRVVQINARLKTPRDFRDIVVARKTTAAGGAANAGGTVVKLWQVADVVDGPQELESLALYNGQRTVLLSVQKSQGENTIAVVDGLVRALDESKALTPPHIRTEINRDNSRSIRVSVANVQRTLIEGAVLTVLIVFLFLNSWRSTVITGLTLPIALIGTFLFMYVFGFTINNITLMALSLCVGLLIDDAIVVRENIVRHLKMGKSAHQAALDGTNEIGLAVLATTLSIVAVFLPIGFMGGIVGKFFHEFGITIVAAVLISMFVSFTLDPMLSSVWHDPAAHGRDPGAPKTLYDRTLGRVTGQFEVLTEWLSRGYQRLLAWSLVHKVKTVLVALSTFVLAIVLLGGVGKEFVPKADFSETQINFYTPVGSSLEVTEMRAKQIDQALRELPEVKHTVTTINSGFAAGKIYGSVYVRLTNRKDRQRSVSDLAVPMRERMERIPGITVTNIGVTDLGGSKSIVFSVQGPDLGELERITRQLMPQLRQIPGLTDLDSTLKPDKPTIAVDVKRDAAADLGLSVNTLANTLRVLVAGTSVGSWRASDGENYDVRLRLAPDSRNSMKDLSELPLVIGANADGSARVVRLSQVADVRSATGPNQINRRDLNREVNIDANADPVTGRSSGEVSADIRALLDRMAWPPGYRYSFGGSTKNMQESFSYAVGALALGVVFIYMILASQFKSFLQPLALMSSLPLTLIGVVAALLLFQSTLNMFSVIGVVMLMGLVTKNAILLVDFAIRAREDHLSPDGTLVRGLERSAALLEAARVRLRPILMTTLAMVFGMVPLAFALTEGSEQRAPMGQAVIGGVITSSLLTLVVVPVVYCWLDDLSVWAKHRLGARPALATPGQPAVKAAP